MPAPTGMQQAKLGMTGAERIDEHGTSDRWDRGGIYDGGGDFDLEATEKLLKERFKPVSKQLPDTVGDFSRTDARTDYSARYESTVPYDDENGVEIGRCTVRVFPQGPYLNRWTVEIREGLKTSSTEVHSGLRSMLHSDARKLESIGAAVATALAVMRGEIPRTRTA